MTWMLYNVIFIDRPTIPYFVVEALADLGAGPAGLGLEGCRGGGLGGRLGLGLGLGWGRLGLGFVFEGADFGSL